MDVTLYSTGCPRCKVLKAKLGKKGIDYKEVNDIDEMTKLGMKSAPALKVDGEMYDFTKANDWINAQGV